MKIRINKLLRVIILPLLIIVLSSCASTKGYYGRAEENVAVISSQRHNVTDRQEEQLGDSVSLQGG